MTQHSESGADFVEAFARGRVLYEEKPRKFRERLAEPAALAEAETIATAA
jgi:hypothetical protein